uniref:Pecanex-like protein n=1 Tax=Taenia asiatica TaxID=60517 RepID=A0A0R3WGR4_TAEAS
LRQIATNVFSIWTPVVGPLLQTRYASSLSLKLLMYFTVAPLHRGYCGVKLALKMFTSHFCSIFISADFKSLEGDLGDHLHDGDERALCQRCEGTVIGDMLLCLTFSGFYLSTAIGVDTSQRNTYLRRFISLGGGLLQAQLASFIDILEQSLYLLWRHLACFLASVSKSEVSTEPVGDCSVSRRCSKRLVDAEFIEQLPRKLSFDLLDSITQVSKAPYLSSSDQLFLQVMAQRLDRFSQMRTRARAGEQES